MDREAVEKLVHSYDRTLQVLIPFNEDTALVRCEDGSECVFKVDHTRLEISRLWTLKDVKIDEERQIPTPIHVYWDENRDPALLKTYIKGVRIGAFQIQDQDQLDRIYLSGVRLIKAIHAKGVVNIDITRRNLLVANDTIRLCDFGFETFGKVLPSNRRYFERGDLTSLKECVYEF